VISTIVVKDAANHTVTFTANASSTASLTQTTNTGSSQSTNQTSPKSKFTDTSVMQADFWVDGFAMPCSPASNLAPVASSTTVNGKITTVYTQPASPSTIRSTCNQLIDFTKSYLVVNGTSSGSTGSSGTSTLPIVDYSTAGKNATTENKKLLSQIDSLNKQISILQQRVTTLQRGGKASVDTSTATSDLPIIDYKAKADALQKEVDALKASGKK